MATSHIRSRELNVETAMNAFNNSMAEIATMEAMSFSFMPEKSTLPIHWGRSGWLSISILETKFS